MGSVIGGKNNVKIFVLYLMENVNYPLTFNAINDIVRQTDYVFYMDFALYFLEMVDDGLVVEEELDGQKVYIVSDKGRLVARELKSNILPSILDQSLRYALRYLDFKRRKVEMRCNTEKLHDGRYQINCSLIESGTVIYSNSLVVDTYERAQRMVDVFNDHPEAVYRGVVALLSGSVDYLLGT